MLLMWSQGPRHQGREARYQNVPDCRRTGRRSPQYSGLCRRRQDQDRETLGSCYRQSHLLPCWGSFFQVRQGSIQ